MLGFTFTGRWSERHYTGVTITSWSLAFHGFELLAWWNDRNQTSTHRRICFLTAWSFHIFTEYLNYLKGGDFGKGVEFGTSLLRYGWPRCLSNWSIGWTTSKCNRSSYHPGSVIHRLGRLAFCNHNSKRRA